MNEMSPDVNSYGGFLDMDDTVCLYQSYDNSIPDDLYLEGNGEDD